MTETKPTELKVINSKPQVPKISVIIVAVDGLPDTIKTIDSLVMNKRIPIEIIVIDNGTKDGTNEWLKSISYLKTIRNESPVEYFKALNEGIKIAEGEYVVLCNNDLIFTQNWDSNFLLPFSQKMMFSELRGVDKIGILSPVASSEIVSSYQQINPIYLKNLKYNADNLNPFAAQYSMSVLGNHSEQKMINASMLSSFCWFIKKVCFDEVGLFKDVKPEGFADFEFIKRLSEYGYFNFVCRWIPIHYKGKNKDIYQGYNPYGLRELPDYFTLNKETGVKKKFVIGIYNTAGKDFAVDGRIETLCDEVIIVDKSENELEGRNILWKKCQKSNADWIMILKPDEIPENKFTRKEIDKLLNPFDPNTMGYRFREINLWNSEKYQNQGGIFGIVSKIKMVRNMPNTHIVWNENEEFVCPVVPEMPEDSILSVRFRTIRHENIDPEYRKRKYEMLRTKYSKNKNILLKIRHYFHPRTSLIEFQPDINFTLMTIMKNEMRHPCHLVDFLRQYYLLFDEMVFIDTGSDDNSKEVAKMFGAKVIHYTWNDDFAAARNFGLKHSTGNYILWTDPDERLGDDPLKWNRLIEENVLAYHVPILNYYNDPNNKFNVTMNYRLFKNIPGIYFEDDVHESITNSILKLADNGFIEKIDISDWRKNKFTVPFPGLHHFGFLRPPAELKRKMKDYVKIEDKILMRNPDNYYALYSKALDYAFHKNDGEAEINLIKALKIKPEHTLSSFELSHLYIRKARVVIEDALKRQGTNTDMKEPLMAVYKAILPFAQPKSNLGINI